MKELIKEFNKYLIAKYGITLDCNYNKDEMYLIYSFIIRSLNQDYDYISDFCNIDLLGFLLETIDLGKPETVFQQTQYVEQYTGDE